MHVKYVITSDLQIELLRMEIVKWKKGPMRTMCSARAPQERP